MNFKSKYPESMEHHATTEWDGITGAIVSVSNDREVIIDTPTTFGGNDSGICPDELFLASVLGCLTNTFLDFQRKFAMELKRLSLKGKAAVKFIDGGYKITEIIVKGEVVVGEDELATGKRCEQLMREYCHLTRSISKCISLKFDVSVREE